MMQPTLKKPLRYGVLGVLVIAVAVLLLLFLTQRPTPVAISYVTITLPATEPTAVTPTP